MQAVQSLTPRPSWTLSSLFWILRSRAPKWDGDHPRLRAATSADQHDPPFHACPLGGNPALLRPGSSEFCLCFLATAEDAASLMMFIDFGFIDRTRVWFALR